MYGNTSSNYNNHTTYSTYLSSPTIPYQPSYFPNTVPMTNVSTFNHHTEVSTSTTSPYVYSTTSFPSVPFPLPIMNNSSYISYPTFVHSNYNTMDNNNKPINTSPIPSNHPYGYMVSDYSSFSSTNINNYSPTNASLSTNIITYIPVISTVSASNGNADNRSYPPGQIYQLYTYWES